VDIDELTDASFKTDTQGRKVFYPFGAFGKGYLPHDVDHYLSLRRKIKLMIILMVFFGGMILDIFGKTVGIVFLSFYAIGCHLLLKRWTFGLEQSHEALPIGLKRRKAVVVLLILSFAFTLCGYWVMAEVHVWAGVAISVFFAFCCILMAWMAHNKSSSADSSDAVDQSSQNLPE
jgi:hypothetical protein